MSEASSRVFSIRHVTGFCYDVAADSSYNEARMTPLSSPTQRVRSSALHVEPFAVQSTYRDYFGTVVTTFDLHERHSRLEVIAEATVERYPDGEANETLALAELRSATNADRYVEYLVPTARTTMSPDVLDGLGVLIAGCQGVGEIVALVIEQVTSRVSYVRGVTHVSSTAEEVWNERRGVCQDLTHVTIAMLRSLGVPARYVSGYLHPHDGAGVGEAILGESHAWVEYFAGEWFGVDPTNGGPVGLGHVAVAKGREYGDVAPIKGVYHGGRSSAAGVTVEITRIG